MSYSNPTSVGYRFPAAALDTAGVIGRIQAPDGKKGRVVDVSTVTTAATTVAACTVTVGTADDADAYATQTIPVTAINLGVQGSESVLNHEIPEDTLVLVTAGGEATAGDGDVTVIIDWY